MKILFMLGMLVILLCSQNVLGQEKSTEQSDVSEKYRSTSFWEGKVFSTEFSPKDLLDTPSWNPEKGNPPISLVKAVKESRAFLKKYFPNYSSWEIERITCDQFGKGKWVYVVEFYLDQKASRDGRAASFSAFLKMDGNFFEPKVSASDKH